MLTLCLIPCCSMVQGVDIWFLHYSIGRTMERVRANRPVGVDLLFAFEYTVQASTIVLTFIKNCL